MSLTTVEEVGGDVKKYTEEVWSGEKVTVEVEEIMIGNINLGILFRDEENLDVVPRNLRIVRVSYGNEFEWVGDSDELRIIERSIEVIRKYITDGKHEKCSNIKSEEKHVESVVDTVHEQIRNLN